MARIIVNDSNIVATILDDSPMQTRDCQAKRNYLMSTREFDTISRGDCTKTDDTTDTHFKFTVSNICQKEEEKVLRVTDTERFEKLN